MKQSKFSEEQIHRAIQQVEAGRKAEEVAREIGVSKHTLYAWRAKYGGLAKDELKKVKDLEEENRRLKQLVADLSLDRQPTASLLGRRTCNGRSPQRNSHGDWSQWDTSRWGSLRKAVLRR